MPDLPSFETVLLEPDAPRPKPIGETASGPVAPAIANAVLDATGIPQLALPITAERLLAALRGAVGGSEAP
jgi:nicotinate dehydrogenase subunit B